MWMSSIWKIDIGHPWKMKLRNKENRHFNLDRQYKCHWISFGEICHICRSITQDSRQHQQNEGDDTKIYLPKRKFHIQCFHIPYYN